MIYSADRIVADAIDALDTEMASYIRLMRPFEHTENIGGTLIRTWGWPRNVIMERLHASYRYQFYRYFLPING